ncbi:MAG: hypothetical protein ACOVMH_08560 [Flavobacterium sp.]
MENKISFSELEKLPLIFSLTELTDKTKLDLENRKVINLQKYRASHYPISHHFKNIVRLL